MTAFLAASALTPKTPKTPEPTEPPPPVPPPPPAPTPPTAAEFSEGAAQERTRARRRRGVQDTVLTSPLGVASVPDRGSLGG